MTRTSGSLRLLAAVVMAACFCGLAYGLDEIPGKLTIPPQWVADGGSLYGGMTYVAGIDGNPNDLPCWQGDTGTNNPTWYRIDMVSRYRV